MKKLTAIFLLITMMLALSACGKEATSSADDASTPSTVSSVDSETADVSSDTETASTEDNTSSKDDTSADKTSSVESSSSSESTPVSSEVSSTKPTHTHSFSAATCTAPKKCSCGATEGKAKGHKYSSGSCTVCGAADPDSKSLLKSGSHGNYVFYLEDTNADMVQAYTVSWNGGTNVKWSMDLYYGVNASKSQIVVNGRHYGDKESLPDYPAPQNVKVTDNSLSFELNNNGVWNFSFTYNNGVLTLTDTNDAWLSEGTHQFKRQ